MFAKFLRDESGVTAIEYTLIAALIAIVAIVAMGFVGNEVTETFDKVGKTLDNAQNR